MKNILFVRGGWDGHTPVESTELFMQILRKEGHTVTVSETLDAYLEADKLAAHDLIVQCVTMSKISQEQWAGLNTAVRAGVGFAGWHGGIVDSFRENTEYQWMTGGQWVAHPGNCIPEHAVEITEPGHEIMQGMSGFKLPDTEQYYLHVDPANRVLCTTTFSGEHGDSTLYPKGVVMPYCWTRSWGKGRVFVAAWGHTFKDFEVPEAREIVRRGLLWAAR